MLISIFFSYGKFYIVEDTSVININDQTIANASFE